MAEKIQIQEKREIWDINKIKPYKNNTKIHTEEQIEKLAGLIKENGFIGAITVDEKGVILAGHGRRLALLKLGAKKVPVNIVSNMSEQQKRAYRIADNMIARGDHDEDILGKEIAYISAIGSNETDAIDLSLLGMDDEEINSYLDKYNIDDVIREMEAQIEEDLLQQERESKESENEKNDSQSKEVEYQKAFSVIVDCNDESEQREIYEQLVAQGKRCKVMTM